MGTREVADVLRYIRYLGSEKEDPEQSDARLLQQFIAQRGDRAFAAILQRHGALGFGICCQGLCDIHDAEDGFQAAFLVPAQGGIGSQARVARSLAPPGSIQHLRDCEDRHGATVGS